MAYIPRLDQQIVLQCLTPPGAAIDAQVEIFTPFASRYRHANRMYGGCWDASFFIPLSASTPEEYLKNWFDSRLFYRIRERAGNATFLGVVWEMELALDGIKERRSMETLYNAIKSVFTNPDGDDRQTIWYTNDTSIARYGRREYILPLDGVQGTEAVATVQSMLAETAEPWPRTIGMELPPERDGLAVTVAGMVFTANNKYITAGNGSDQNISTFIRDIIDTDCEYLTAGRIQTNTTQVATVLPTPTRAWDALYKLAQAGDGASPWTIQVGAQGFVHYEPASADIKYEWHGRARGMRSVIGEHSPWSAWPGVMRNLRKRSGTPIPGTFLTDSRDTWISEVEMADGRVNPTLKPDGFDEDEITRAADQFEGWLKKERQSRKGNGDSMVQDIPITLASR